MNSLEVLLTEILIEVRKIGKSLSQNKQSLMPATQSENITNVAKDDGYLTIKEYCQKNEWPSESEIRIMIQGTRNKYSVFYKKFDDCFKKEGSRIVLNEKEFKKVLIVFQISKEFSRS